MEKTITKLLIILFLFTSCKKKEEQNSSNILKIHFNLEKIIVVNINEASMTFFKIKVRNDNQNTIILYDNSLSEFRRKKMPFKKMGFYLRNIKNDSLIMLSIDENYFYEVPGKKSNYFFLETLNLKKSFSQKDSLKLKKTLSNYVLEYNGKNLNIDNIKRSPHINQSYYNSFIERKETFIPFIDNIVISELKDKIKMKYLDKLPIKKDEWDNL